MTITCAACGHPNPDQAKFCLECGAARTLACARCRTTLPSGAKFCLECGNPIAAQPSEGPEVDRGPRAYTPKHLADKILQSKSALEGERKQVTVLFADVKGSMELSEQLDPEEWHRILERFFEILTDGVHRFEGTVNQYTGDGIMALFGAPIAHEDHAQRACYSALHLRDALRTLAQELRRSRGFDFQTRIGLNSGDVIVGKIGDDLRMDYTAQGHTVGLAQRMEQLAEAGAVYVAPATATRVAGYFELEDLGEFTLKGVREPCRVAALRSVGRLRTRLDLARARGFSRFVGRVDETAVLEAALANAQGGRGRVVGVVGEPGTGKSRLCFEFAESARARAIAVRTASCVSHGRNMPLLPMLELLRALVEVDDRDAPDTVRNKVAGAALLADRALEDVLPSLFDMLGVPQRSGVARSADAEQRVRGLLATLRALLQARSRRAETTIVLLEDLHWVDAASETFLENLVEDTADSHTLLVLNFRPEYHARWMARSWYQQVPLRPLGQDAADELLRELLGNDASVAAIASHIRERTGGNPFFIEECVQALAEQGALAGSRGAYRLAVELPTIVLPARVEALLAARIDRLGERERAVLRAASAIGLNVRAPLLARVADVPAAVLEFALRELVAAELLREVAVYPEPEYAFKHPLTQQVAYESQLATRRAQTHAHIARVLAEGSADEAGEKAALIAHHLDLAGETLDAARWHRHAANWAGPFRPEIMAHHWRRVRDLVRGLRETPVSAALLVDASFGLCEALRRIRAQGEEAADVHAMGLAAARSLGSFAAEAKVTLAYCVYRLATWTADAEDVRRIESIGERAETLEDDGLRAYLYYASALARNQTGAGDARLAAERGLDILASNPNCARNYPQLEVFLAMHLAIAEIQAGRLDAARTVHARLDQLVRGSTRTSSSSIAASIATRIAAAAGQFDVALHRAREEYARAVTQDSVPGIELSVTRIAEAQQALGDAVGVSATLDALSERRGQILEPSLRAYLHLQSGDLDAAETNAREYLEIVRSGANTFFEPVARAQLARVLLRRHGREAHDAALEQLSEAESTASGGRRIHLPHICEARAELARVIGDAAEHDRQLHEALRLYTEMGADGHVARLSRTLLR